MRTTICLNAVALFTLLTGPLLAQPATETVLDGLVHPSGVAIQPETNAVFVSDSGAGRVVRVEDGKAVEVITGFPRDVYGKGPMYDIGPLGLLFLDQNTLVVGGGGYPDGEELLRIYDLSGGKPLKASQMKASFSLPGNDDLKGEGNFYALAATDRGIFVTSNGDDTKGWVARLVIRRNGKFGKFERYIATKEATEVDAPVAATISPRGELAIGQMGEITLPGDGLLTLYNPRNGKMLLNLETGLNDITALAYSPGGQLFATDFSWIDTSQGGLFQLIATNDGGTQGVEAKRILTLDKPAAMTFAADGALYVTVFGSGEKGGKLLKIKL